MLDDTAPTGKPTGRICHQVVIIRIHAEIHVVWYWTADNVLEYDLSRHWGSPCSTLLDGWLCRRTCEPAIIQTLTCRRAKRRRKLTCPLLAFRFTSMHCVCTTGTSSRTFRKTSAPRLHVRNQISNPHGTSNEEDFSTVFSRHALTFPTYISMDHPEGLMRSTNGSGASSCTWRTRPSAVCPWPRGTASSRRTRLSGFLQFAIMSVTCNVLSRRRGKPSTGRRKGSWCRRER